MRSLPPPIVIEDPAALNRLVDQLRSEPAIAVDTESNSLFVYQEHVCLVQISTPEADYIVDPLAVPDLQPLRPILADPQILKVFHAAEYDLICLKRDYRFEVGPIFDTMQAVRILGWNQVGLASILEAQFGVQLDKRWQRADWGQRPLPDPALDYARMDTHFLLALQRRMEAELQSAGRLAEALEEFQRLAAIRPVVRAFDPEGFWRMSGAQDLDPVGQAILRELFVYREEQARQSNRPPFKVLSDQALIEMANYRPQHEVDLQGINGLAPSQVRRFGPGLLAAVERGLRAAPPKQTKLERPDDDVMARYDALHTWRKLTAQRRGVESDIIVPRETLWTLARRDPVSSGDLNDIEGLGPWRLQAYGDQILEVLRKMRK